MEHTSPSVIFICYCTPWQNASCIVGEQLTRTTLHLRYKDHFDSLFVYKRFLYLGTHLYYTKYNNSSSWSLDTWCDTPTCLNADRHPRPCRHAPRTATYSSRQQQHFVPTIKKNVIVSFSVFCAPLNLRNHCSRSPSPNQYIMHA